MSLPNAVQGSLRPSLLITWYELDSTDAVDLTGATLSGFIGAASGIGSATAITGTLTLTDAANGIFRWDFSAADVATAGRLKVQFVATFGSGQTPAKTFQADWSVERGLAVT